MKWGKNKAVASSPSPSPSASYRPFLISHVIPASWLTKFKQMSVSPRHTQQQNATKSNRKGGKLNSNPAITRFTSPNCTPVGGRFYSADGDDEFWRLSFGADDGEEYYISDEDDEVRFPPPSCRSCCTRSNRVGAKMREEEVAKSFTLPLDIGNFPVVERDKAMEITNPRIRSEKKKNNKVKKSKQRVFELGSEGEFKLAGSELSNSLPQMDGNGSAWNAQKQSYEISAVNYSPHYWGELEETKMEDKRKSLYIRIEPLQRKQSNKRQGGKERAHCHSPRTPARSEVCKIRAIEDMRRSGSKTTKRKAKPVMKSFAVVKSSYDPENDFKESMIEMIQEMKIRKTEGLEELLACYLMLNCEEYHELIINVFRQVWFDLNHHAGLSWSRDSVHM